MKIAVIGSGFYGSSVALELSKDYPDIKIDLYEKCNDIFKGAASNNQHRIHKGFHYPRSNETIDQILNNYQSFKDKYHDLISPVKDNYYLIEKNSKVNLEEYINKYKSFGIPFREIDNFEVEPFVNTELIEGGISNTEEVINLKKAYEYFKERITNSKNISLKLKKNITEIDGNKIDDEKYDYIINCTYNNPNLGIVSKDKILNLKYEICIIPVVENFFKEDICITIMDGKYVSAYQNGLGDITLSSVSYTPYFKTDYHEEFITKLRRDSIDKDLMLKYDIHKLLNHCSEYFKGVNTSTPLKELYLSPKVKLKEDTNDLRTTSIVRDGCVISVLCGKISSIVSTYELIKKEIDGN
jgi:hypothetical protein